MSNNVNVNKEINERMIPSTIPRNWAPRKKIATLISKYNENKIYELISLINADAFTLFKSTLEDST
jgi:hypothetical protein